jgi:hypothetical protein
MPPESMALIEKGIKDWRATGATMFVPYYLRLKAEVLHSAARTSEALEATGSGAKRRGSAGGFHQYF